jgi:Zn-dependent protease with chaperone function
VKSLILFEAAAFSAAFACIANWLALIPWRRAKERHWTERARLYYPVRASAQSNLWVLPAVLTMGAVLMEIDDLPHWTLMVLATGIGTVVGTIPMDREVCTRIPFKELLRTVSVGWLIRFLMWLVFLGAIALMPNEFNLQGLAILAVFLFLLTLWSWKGWIWTGRKLGFLLPPPERLQKIVQDTAARMNVPVGEVCLLRSFTAQAFAMSAGRRLLFTDRLLEILSDDEVAAICSHELAHLTEPRSTYFQRHMIWLSFLPWIFLKPMVHTLGFSGFIVLLLFTFLVPIACRQLSHRLEVRADAVAHSNEPDSGVYARALTRLYEDALAPAVNARESATHPHLYDRLLAAGVTPDFPRPEPPARLAWHGRLLSWLLALLAVALAIRLSRNE